MENKPFINSPFSKQWNFPASRRIPLPQLELITKPAPLHDDNHKFVINAG
jgi:hypothetical protein